jgi:hypothetical protein
MRQMNLSSQQRLSFVLGPSLMFAGFLVAMLLGAPLFQKSHIAFIAVCVSGGLLGQVTGSWLGSLIPRVKDAGRTFRRFSVVIMLAGVPFALMSASDVYAAITSGEWEALTSAAFSGLAALSLFLSSGHVGTKAGFLASSILTALAVTGTMSGGRFVADLPVLISAAVATGALAILVLKGRDRIV